MALSHINGIALSVLSAIKGVAKATISYISGQEIGGGSVNGLLAKALAGWKCDEASGDFIDFFGSVDLTDNNTVTSDTGHVYALAREFDSANSENADAANPAIITFNGNVSFSIAAWFRTPSVGSFLPILGKWSATGPGNTEYAMMHENTYGVNCHISNGTTLGEVYSGSNVSVDTWHLAIFRHDAAADEISIQVDNGTPVVAAHSVGVQDADKDFRIGRANTDYFTGLIGPVVIFTGVLTPTDSDNLWNGGDGLPLEDFD